MYFLFLGGIENNVDNLCMSLKNTVKLTTPLKRSLHKNDFSDLTENSLSPKKKESIEGTPNKNIPRQGRGRPRKLNNDSPMKTDENQVS